MSGQTLNRWGGFVTVAFALTVMVAAVALYFTREQGLGDPRLPQTVYSLSFLVAPFALMAVYLPQARRAGKVGIAGFVSSLLGITLQIAPAFIWMAILSGAAWGHEALMFSWWGGVPVLPIGTYMQLAGTILLGIATWRAGLYPRGAGLLLVVSGLLDLPLELPMVGGMFAALWPFSVAALGLGLAWIGMALLTGADQVAARAQSIPASTVV